MIPFCFVLTLVIRIRTNYSDSGCDDVCSVHCHLTAVCLRSSRQYLHPGESDSSLSLTPPHWNLFISLFVVQFVHLFTFEYGDMALHCMLHRSSFNASTQLQSSHILLSRTTFISLDLYLDLKISTNSSIGNNEWTETSLPELQYMYLSTYLVQLSRSGHSRQ